MGQYAINPNFKGTKEEAERQIAEYEEVVKWLEEHPGCVVYDKDTERRVVTIDAPECVIRRIESVNEAEKKRRERIILLKEMGILE